MIDFDKSIAMNGNTPTVIARVIDFTKNRSPNTPNVYIIVIGSVFDKIMRKFLCLIFIHLPAQKAANGKAIRYPPTGLSNTEKPPANPANTGNPIAPRIM